MVVDYVCMRACVLGGWGVGFGGGGGVATSWSRGKCSMRLPFLNRPAALPEP